MSTLISKPVADAVVSCTDDELIVTLVDGRKVSAPLEWFPRLLRATPQQRAKWRLIGGGVGIHWQDVDERHLSSRSSGFVIPGERGLPACWFWLLAETNFRLSLCAVILLVHFEAKCYFPTCEHTPGDRSRR